jgi:putative membrane protein insertion efficiency factor
VRAVGPGEVVLSRLLLAPIRWYRRYLSPLKRTPTCRYLPTCSDYAQQAIEMHGPIVGGWKALLRILRCNPLFRGGFDPVSPRCDHAHHDVVSEGP